MHTLRIATILLVLVSEYCSLAKVQIACRGKEKFLECGGNDVILVEDAFYGRTQPDVCEHDTVSFCYWNATSFLKELCDCRSRCRIVTRWSFLNRNPCASRINKYIQANYTCVSNSTACQGNIVTSHLKPTTIPDPASHASTVKALSEETISIPYKSTSNNMTLVRSSALYSTIIPKRVASTLTTKAPDSSHINHSSALYPPTKPNLSNTTNLSNVLLPSTEINIKKTSDISSKFFNFSTTPVASTVEASSSSTTLTNTTTSDVQTFPTNHVDLNQFRSTTVTFSTPSNSNFTKYINYSLDFISSTTSSNITSAVTTSVLSDLLTTPAVDRSSVSSTASNKFTSPENTTNPITSTPLPELHTNSASSATTYEVNALTNSIITNQTTAAVAATSNVTSLVKSTEVTPESADASSFHPTNLKLTPFTLLNNASYPFLLSTIVSKFNVSSNNMSSETNTRNSTITTPTTNYSSVPKDSILPTLSSLLTSPKLSIYTSIKTETSSDFTRIPEANLSSSLNISHLIKTFPQANHSTISTGSNASFLQSTTEYLYSNESSFKTTASPPQNTSSSLASSILTSFSPSLVSNFTSQFTSPPMFTPMKSESTATFDPTSSLPLKNVSAFPHSTDVLNISTKPVTPAVPPYQMVNTTNAPVLSKTTTFSEMSTNVFLLTKLPTALEKTNTSSSPATVSNTSLLNTSITATASSPPTPSLSAYASTSNSPLLASAPAPTLSSNLITSDGPSIFITSTSIGSTKLFTSNLNSTAPTAPSSNLTNYRTDSTQTTLSFTSSMLNTLTSINSSFTNPSALPVNSSIFSTSVNKTEASASLSNKTNISSIPTATNLSTTFNLESTSTTFSNASTSPNEPASSTITFFSATLTASNLTLNLNETTPSTLPIAAVSTIVIPVPSTFSSDTSGTKLASTVLTKPGKTSTSSYTSSASAASSVSNAGTAAKIPSEPDTKTEKTFKTVTLLTTSSLLPESTQTTEITKHVNATGNAKSDRATSTAGFYALWIGIALGITLLVFIVLALFFFRRQKRVRTYDL